MALETECRKSPDQVTRVLTEITQSSFTDWRDERAAVQNLREGQPWLNKPPRIADSIRISPHQLLQCQRKTYYKHYNAPQEDKTPNGLFWVGTKFEEELILPYLADIVDRVDGEAYVRNSAWIDTEIQTEGRTVRLKGETDPVICTRTGEPFLLTEVKNKSSLEKYDTTDPEPDERHKAQAHAYMYGLSESSEFIVDQALILYGDRKHHDLLPIPIEFDETFWQETVLPWAASQTEYRKDTHLPPAEPREQWECEYCNFKERCGQGTEPYDDEGPVSFLPLFVYPKENVTTCLDAEGQEATHLTPTLAHHYPELAVEYEVAPWECVGCHTQFPWDCIDWDGNTSRPPLCPTCAETEASPPPLRGARQ